MDEIDLSSLDLTRKEIKDIVGGKLQGQEVGEFMQFFRGRLTNEQQVRSALQKWEEGERSQPFDKVDVLADQLRRLPGQREHDSRA